MVPLGKYINRTELMAAANDGSIHEICRESGETHRCIIVSGYLMFESITPLDNPSINLKKSSSGMSDRLFGRGEYWYCDITDANLEALGIVAIDDLAVFEQINKDAIIKKYRENFSTNLR